MKTKTFFFTQQIFFNILFTVSKFDRLIKMSCKWRTARIQRWILPEFYIVCSSAFRLGPKYCPYSLQREGPPPKTKLNKLYMPLNCIYCLGFNSGDIRTVGDLFILMTLRYELMEVVAPVIVPSVIRYISYSIEPCKKHIL